MTNEYIEYNLTNAKFVAGIGELCFKEVLDDFENAKCIYVLTYNISSKNNQLINALKSNGQRGIPIKVISNIPNRWENYFCDNWRNKAHDSIELYIKKLNPEQIGNLASVFFRFNNHGKIVMTDNVAYWGSANYSDESKKNYECGTISRDKTFIKFLQEKVFPAIINESVSYYKRDFIDYITSMYSAISYMHNMYQEIHDASYGEYEDYDTNFNTVEFFNFQENYLSWGQLENMMETTNEFVELLNGIISEIEDDEEIDEGEYEELDEFVSRYVACFELINEEISNICFQLEDMTRFDEEETTNTILSDKYGMVAYDEKLEYYLEKASDEAREIREELIEQAEDSIKALIESVEKYEDKLRDFVNELIALSKINDEIDNT